MLSIVASGIVVESPGMMYAFNHSDGVGKGIVILLTIFNAFAWSIMIEKISSLLRAKKENGRFWNVFRNSNGELNLLTPPLLREKKLNGGPISRVYRAGMEKILEFAEGNPENPDNVFKLTDSQTDAVEAEVLNAAAIEAQELERNVVLIASAVTLSPFFGLFGTVWGVMMAFCGIAAAGKSDFTALAPGVAGALLTTVLGLIVAIPSVIGYNAMNCNIRQLTISMDNFVDQFMTGVNLARERCGAKNK